MLDRHCIRCHNDRQQKQASERLERPVTRERDPAWSAYLPRGEAGGTTDSGGATAARAVDGATNRTAFSLLGEGVVDKVAKRRWSDAYLNLTLSQPSDYYEAVGAYFGVFDGRVVNWIGSQSIPAPLPPGVAGACRSDLLPLLESGHGGVKLTREELDKLACWIDLFVPYCGDYFEANTWAAEDKAKYDRYLAKRKRMEALERESLEAFVARQAAR